MTDPVYKALTTLRDRYPHDPELETEDGFRSRMHALTRQARDMAGKRWDTCAASNGGQVDGEKAVEWALDAHARSLCDVLEQYVAQTLPSRAVHDVRHHALYEAAKALTPVPAHVDDPGTDEYWQSRADESHMHTEHLGVPADYSGFDPIEDVAIPPAVTWTAADEAAALERLIERDGIDPGHWYELEWPPRAHLWDAGHVYETDWECCDKHADEQATEGCIECDASVRQIVESPARWKFTVEVRTLRLRFDEVGNETEVHVAMERDVEIGELSQDPRRILVGEPGRGVRW